MRGRTVYSFEHERHRRQFLRAAMAGILAGAVASVFKVAVGAARDVGDA